MNPAPVALLLLVLGMAVLISAFVAAVALARWHGAAIPAAVIPGE
ncbi:hypothetical protein ABT300_21085 [Streptomyces sp. NPDC001027]